MKRKGMFTKCLFAVYIIAVLIWGFSPYIKTGIVFVDRRKEVIRLTPDNASPVLVDPEATAETRHLIKWLSTSAKDYMLFGQQNGNAEAIKERKGIVSDVYHMVGTYPAVIGYDMSDVEHRPEYFVQKAQEAYQNNCVITLSDHMPEFRIKEIMPGGICHPQFLKQLDETAVFAAACVSETGTKIPIIYRPYHENSGDWFWWGTSNTTREEFISLWRFTIEYLRDKKGVDNFLYAYSPNGHFKDANDYLKRYPGDEYVDIIGFDIYDDTSSYDSGWMEQVKNDARIVVNIAVEKNKLAALCETGHRYNGTDGLKVSGNEMTDWFYVLHNTLKSDETSGQIAYMMAWRNEDKDHFFVPYDGHEMERDFIRFYNLNEVLFSNQLGNIYLEYN